MNAPAPKSVLQLSSALLITELSKPNATITTVAERLGCTASAISQALSNDPALQQKVLEARLVAAKTGLYLDEKYDSLEKLALDRLEQVLPYVNNPMQLARISQTMNAAKRRAGPQLQDDSGQKTVRILMPKIVEMTLKLSERNEVVQIGDRALVTMPAAQVMKNSQERLAAIPTTLEDII